MAIRPTIISVGSATPAIHGSKYTSNSCKPTKYQGAFEGFGVLFGSARGSRGAGISIDQSHKKIVVTKKHRTIVYMKYGQVNSYCSELAVGTGRLLRFVARGASRPRLVIAMTFPLLQTPN